VPKRSTRARWLRRILLFAVSIACARIILDLVGAIDWDVVRTSIENLNAWQFVVLVAVLILRQVLNALPLVYFIDGLSVFRATASDQGTTLTSMIAPPTSDTVLRIVVLRSWGIDTGAAAAGSTCNILVFYMARWVAPLVGVLILIGVRFDATYGATAAVSFLIALAILVGVLLVTRSTGVADRLGRAVGRLASRVRHTIEPEKWAASFVEFQTQVASGFRTKLALSLPTLVAKILVDALIVLLAIRFVGIGPDQLPALEIVAAFLVVFPLTLFPLHGLGILDAALVAALTAVGGIELEAQLVAALATYRVVTLGAPAVLGAIFLLWWRHSTRYGRHASVQQV
jgi:uncharacterized membrane protein YbhN (UPF0104 family)